MHDAAERPGPRRHPTAIPPHRPQVVEGIHAYTDRVSVAAGETIRFHVSSSHPYELQVCRLGHRRRRPGRATRSCIRSARRRRPSSRSIRAHTCIVGQAARSTGPSLPALTLEVWIRRWRTIGRQAIISQFDQPDALRLRTVRQRRRLARLLSRRRRRLRRTRICTRRLPANSRWRSIRKGSKHFPDNTPSSVLSNQWHHVVARFDGDVEAGLGRRPRRWPSGSTSGPMRPGDAPLRIGAAGQRRTGRRLPRRRHRHAGDLRQGPVARRDHGPVRRSGTVTADAIPTCSAAGRSTRNGAIAQPTPARIGRHARIINHGTWMIGGPSFDADVPRFGTLRPREGPSARPRPAAGFRRSLRLPLEGDRTNIGCPRTPGRASTPAGSVSARRRRASLSHAYSSSRRRPARPKAPIAFLCSTNTWRAYAATPFSPTWKGTQEVDRQQRLRQQPRRSAGVLLLSAASRGAGDVSDRASGCPGRSSARTR